MGRTIKISELKKFDVFKWGEYTYVCFGDGFTVLNSDDLFYSDFADYNNNAEVELIGHMEFRSELNEVEKDLGHFATRVKKYNDEWEEAHDRDLESMQ